MADDVLGTGTPGDPWKLTTPPGKSEFEAYRDPDANPPALVVQVGSTQLRYHLRCIEDLHTMLKAHGTWMPLGNADEQKDAKPGTVECVRVHVCVSPELNAKEACCPAALVTPAKLSVLLPQGEEHDGAVQPDKDRAA